MPKILKFLMIILVIGGGYVFYAVSENLQTRRHDVSLSITDPGLAPTSMAVAVVGDVHLSGERQSLDMFRDLLTEIKRAKPDLVLFVGDYIDYSVADSIADAMSDFLGSSQAAALSARRHDIINIFKFLDPLPRAIVLGNHESLTDAGQWLVDFKRLDVEILENSIDIITTQQGPVCIRGLGDMHTDRFSYIDFPVQCDGLPKLTITHDPAGAFDPRMRGLVIAGHTHCGQISLPLIGPLWVPSTAPPAAHCGLYQDHQRKLFVTSGVGTSILPLRFGAPSQWDMITIDWNQ